MSVLDTLKGLVGSNNESHSYDDAAYEDRAFDEEQTGYRRDYSSQSDNNAPSGRLGNTSRPNAESINVYTRSGRFVESNSVLDDIPETRAYDYQASHDDWQPSSSSYSPTTSTPSYGQDAASFDADRYPFARHAATQSEVGRSSSYVSQGRSSTRGTSNLPAYVLAPQAYEDVLTMVSRVRTNQPVVLDFANTKIDTAKRILDYSFGFAMGVNGSVQELGDRCFVVLPHAVELSQSEIDKLERSGSVRR